MEFRPCIDIHNGKIKQIVGSSLSDASDEARENYASDKNGDYYGHLYREKNLPGGHVILLNPKTSPYYEETKKQAMLALGAYPGGLQVGGGITDENAAQFLAAGADKVIVTSFVFQDGCFQEENLKKLMKVVGKEHLTLDLSCRKVDGVYRIVTDRWQKVTQMEVNERTLSLLAESAAEFLIHAVDVEGKSGGVEEELLSLLGSYNGLPITYAGGVHSYGDLDTIYKAGSGRIHATVGSALDIFGGTLSMDSIVQRVKMLNAKE